MMLTPLLALATASLAIAIPFDASLPVQKRQHGTSCSSDQFVPVQTSGETHDGTPFCETGWEANYVPITGVSTFSTNLNVTGIAFHYANGYINNIYGTADFHTSAQTISVDFSKGERWKSIVMTSEKEPYTNCVNTIDMTTSTGQEQYVGASQAQFAGNGMQTSQPVGSGILFGVVGNSDSVALRDIGFVFLASPISSIEINHLEYPNGPNGNDGINIQNVDAAHYYNQQTSQDLMWTFGHSRAVTNTYAFAQATAQMYGGSEAFKFGFSFKIIDIGVDADSTTAFTWGTSYTDTDTTTVSVADTVTWSASGKLSPGQGVNCLAEVGTSSGSFPYISTVTIHLQNGYSFTYQESGTLTLNDVSQAVTLVSTANHP